MAEELAVAVVLAASLTCQFLAERVGFEPTVTVYDLIASGELESVRIKSSRRNPIAAIERYVERLLDESPRR